VHESDVLSPHHINLMIYVCDVCICVCVCVFIYVFVFVKVDPPHQPNDNGHDDTDDNNENILVGWMCIVTKWYQSGIEVVSKRI
jgi:hypothetical protein